MAEREAHYCGVVEQRRFREVCVAFVELRMHKEQLPPGNYACSAAINGKRCPIRVEAYPPMVRKERKKRVNKRRNADV